MTNKCINHSNRLVDVCACTLMLCVVQVYVCVLCVVCGFVVCILHVHKCINPSVEIV